MTRLPLWLPLALLLPTPAPALDPARLDGLAPLVRQFKADTGQSTGTAIVVVGRDGVIHEAYTGHADLRAGRPVDADTVFYIASVTKPLLALSVLTQAARGELDTGMSLQQMFPATTFDGIEAGRIRIRHLLTHTAGIDNPPLVWATAYSGLHDARSRTALLAATTPNAEAPWGRFDYSNVGYNVLSVWLDQHFEQPWQQQLHEHVFAPLGMQRSSTSIRQARAAGWTLARPYSRLEADPEAPLALEKDDTTMHAAGGVVASARDLGRLLQAELDRGRVDGKQAVPATVIARSQQVQIRFPTETTLDFGRDGYAWGWYAGDYQGQRMLHHFGGFAGFHAHLSFLPEQGVGLVVLNNEDFLAPRLTALIADYVYASALGEADVDARLRGRFSALAGETAALDAKIAAHRRALAARPWTLSLPMAAYAGRYTHPWLGDVHLSLDAAGRPTLCWGRLQASATGYEDPDSLRVELVPNSGQVVHFEVRDGAVRALRLAEMTFTRREGHPQP